MRGGAGLFYDKITLNAATFYQLPARIITRYGAEGQSLAGAPRIERPVVDGGRLRNPENLGWNLEVDREVTARLALRVGCQQRNGSRELLLDPRSNGALDGVLLLANAGRSRYRELELTGRYRTAKHQLVITNHFNPRDFQGNLTSDRFGDFSNGVSRTFRGKFVIDF